MRISSVKNQSDPAWDGIMDIDWESFLQAASAYHKSTIRIALSLNGSPRVYANRMFLNTDGALVLVRMLGMRTDGSSLSGTATEAKKGIKWVGSPPPAYDILPRRDLVISKVIEARRIAYWAQIQSPRHDGLSDKEIMDYSKKCRKHSEAEFLAQIKRGNGEQGRGKQEPGSNKGKG